MDQFLFELVIEALDERVVVAVAFGRHALPHLVVPQDLAHGFGDVLASTVAVKNESGLNVAPPDWLTALFSTARCNRRFDSSFFLLGDPSLPQNAPRTIRQRHKLRFRDGAVSPNFLRERWGAGPVPSGVDVLVHLATSSYPAL